MKRVIKNIINRKKHQKNKLFFWSIRYCECTNWNTSLVSVLVGFAVYDLDFAGLSGYILVFLQRRYEQETFRTCTESERWQSHGSLTLVISLALALTLMIFHLPFTSRALGISSPDTRVLSYSEHLSPPPPLIDPPF